MVHLAPCTNKCTAEKAAALLHQNIIRLHGTPKTLISDRDPRFTSAYWKGMCVRLGIDHRFSTAFHAETDGQTERANQVVEEVVRGLTGANTHTWESVLPFVEFCKKKKKSASTGFSPFFLVYGMHPRTPVVNSLDHFRDHPLPALQAVLQEMDSTLETAKTLQQAALDRQATYANQRRRPHTFQADQYVMLNSKNLRFRGKGRRKLYPRFIGPFLITEMVGPNAARLRLPVGWAMHPVFHVSLLKLYKGNVASAELLEQLPLAADSTPQFQIAHILAYRVRSRGSSAISQFLVQWKDFSPEHASWVDRDTLPDEPVEQYLRSVSPPA
jgi:hypothetical protein